MNAIYDKLLFMRRLEGEGLFSRSQAEALSEAVHQAMGESVATKSDLADVRHEMGSGMADLRREMADLRHEMVTDMADLRHEIALTRSELKLWMGSLAAVLFGSLGGLMTVFRFVGH